MTDDRTTHLNLPLPHRDNFIFDDVERLREALIAIDAELAAQRQAIEEITPPPTE